MLIEPKRMADMKFLLRGWTIRPDRRLANPYGNRFPVH